MGYAVLLGLVVLAWLVWKKMKDRAAEKRLANRTAELIKSGVLQSPTPPSVAEVGSDVQTGPDEDYPFGIDIKNPDAFEIPLSFHGLWAHPTIQSADAVEIAARQIMFLGKPEEVVAVMLGETDQISVVTVNLDAEHALHHFGLKDGGQKLVDLENMDWVLSRC